MTSAETESRILRQIASLEERLKELGIDTEMLDDLTLDCSSEEVSEINNSGMPAQLDYLLRRAWTPEDIINRAKMAKEENT